MNLIKNKLKIFIRNINHYLKLLKEKELPRKSIFLLDSSVENYNSFMSNSNNNKPLLLLSSNNHKHIKSRIKEINKMFKILGNFYIVFFNHVDRDVYMRQNWSNHPIYRVYKKSSFQQMKSDIFRYCFIYQHGGFWLDSKSTIFFDISELLEEDRETLLIYSKQSIEEDYEFLISPKLLGITQNSYIQNWVFGAKKNSKFLEYLINNISTDYLKYCDKVFENPKNAILNLTGPMKITKLFYQYLNEEVSRKDEFNIVSEINHDFQYISEYGRGFSIFDNVFKKHYGNVINKKIIN